MGPRPVGVIGVHRPRWRAYLLLARISNVPTIWSNVLAGMAVAALSIHWTVYAQTAIAISCFYIGGMFLNDAFDADIDARQRPERPIPAGNVTRSEAFLIGSLLLAAGLLLVPRGITTLLCALTLVAAIVFYDYRHKGDRLAPLVMGICRGLVYFIAGSTTAAISLALVAAALALTLYVAGLTVVARLAGANARRLVPLLIAGISLLDASIIWMTAESVTPAAVAALGFPLTLLLQRIVPGD